MIKLQMNDTLKRRFAFRKVCPVCNNPIYEWDDIQYVKFQYGKLRIYTFFHTNCLVKHTMQED